LKNYGALKRTRTSNPQIRSLHGVFELSVENDEKSPENTAKIAENFVAELAQKLRLIAAGCISACSANATQGEGERD